MAAAVDQNLEMTRRNNPIMTTPPTLDADPCTDPTAAPAAVAAAISRSHIGRLRQSVSDYAARLAPRLESCRNEYADRSYAVLEHLLKSVPATKPRKVGLFPVNGRHYAPLEWVRFPLDVNLSLRNQAQACGIKLAPHHERVPRDKRNQVSRAVQADPEVYDWPWHYEDFRRKGVGAQPWEAALAADFEAAVTGPLRRALRASRQIASHASELRPVEEIQFDLLSAESLLCEKLRLPRPAEHAVAEHCAPNRAAPRAFDTTDDDSQLRLGLLTCLREAIESRLRACAAEYTVAAALLRDRLDPDRCLLWQGPVLAPRVLVPPGVVADPIIVWQAAERGHRSDPSDPLAEGWRDLAWNRAEHRAKYRSYAASCSVRRQRRRPAREYFWFTEAPRLIKDFEPAQTWERCFALHYDQTVVTPLRRQWLLARWSMRLEPTLVEPETCVLALDLQKYLPHEP